MTAIYSCEYCDSIYTNTKHRPYCSKNCKILHHVEKQKKYFNTKRKGYIKELIE